MEIIQPCHYIPSSRVKSWRQIKEDALALREFVKGPFKGEWERAYAISHAQVSNEPKQFFVLDESVDDKSILDAFGSWCVINLNITFSDPSSEVIHSEGCMSFPHRLAKRVDRFEEIEVSYSIPILIGPVAFLVSKKKKLSGMAAFIAQHESGHAQGKNIYFE